MINVFLDCLIYNFTPYKSFFFLSNINNKSIIYNITTGLFIDIFIIHTYFLNTIFIILFYILHKVIKINYYNIINLMRCSYDRNKRISRSYPQLEKPVQ